MTTVAEAYWCPLCGKTYTSKDDGHGRYVTTPILSSMWGPQCGCNDPTYSGLRSPTTCIPVVRSHTVNPQDPFYWVEEASPPTPAQIFTFTHKGQGYLRKGRKGRPICMSDVAKLGRSHG